MTPVSPPAAASGLVQAGWTRGGGWEPPRTSGPSRLDLGASTSFLHYGQAVFEGLRAVRSGDGRLLVFRPGDHHRRLLASAARMALPAPARDRFEQALRLAAAAHAADLTEPGDSVYLRPLLVATTETLGISEPVADCLFLVLPVAGFRHLQRPGGLSVRLERELRRSWPGGVGAVKCAGNYGLARFGQDRARAAGCDDALWLSERGNLAELSSSNVFLVRRGTGRDRLLTPRADGTILDGVTRRSVLALAGDLDLIPVEQDLPVEEVLAGIAAGSVPEMFTTGTAGGIVPVGVVHDRGRRLELSGRTSHAAALDRLLTAVRTGRGPDRHGWLLDLAAVPDPGTVDR